MPHEPLPPQDHQQQIGSLLLRLGSGRSADRWTAQTELRKMPVLPCRLLLAYMVRLARVRRQAPFLLFLGLLTSGIVLLGLLLIFDHLYGRISHVPVLLAGLVGAALMLRRWIAMRDAAARALANYNDPRAVGPLVEHLAEMQGDGETRKVARELLVHLSPKLQAGNADTLTASQRAGLLLLLDSGDTDLIVAVLKALEQIGGEEAEQKVRLLWPPLSTPNRPPTGREMPTPDGQRPTPDAGLQQAAQKCLQAMAARRTQDRLRGKLLRVIDSNDASQPATPARDSQPQGTVIRDTVIQNTLQQGEDS